MTDSTTKKIEMKMHTEAAFDFRLAETVAGGGGVTYPPLVEAPPIAQYQAALAWVAKNVTPGNLVEIKPFFVSVHDNGDLGMTLGVIYWG